MVEHIKSCLLHYQVPVRHGEAPRTQAQLCLCSQLRLHPLCWQPWQEAGVGGGKGPAIPQCVPPPPPTGTVWQPNSGPAMPFLTAAPSAGWPRLPPLPLPAVKCPLERCFFRDCTLPGRVPSFS